MWRGVGFRGWVLGFGRGRVRAGIEELGVVYSVYLVRVPNDYDGF